MLFKFQSEVAEIAEKRRQEEIAKKREVLRLNLAEQVRLRFDRGANQEVHALLRRLFSEPAVLLRAFVTFTYF